MDIGTINGIDVMLISFFLIANWIRSDWKRKFIQLEKEMKEEQRNPNG